MIAALEPLAGRTGASVSRCDDVPWDLVRDVMRRAPGETARADMNLDAVDTYGHAAYTSEQRGPPLAGLFAFGPGGPVGGPRRSPWPNEMTMIVTPSRRPLVAV